MTAPSAPLKRKIFLGYEAGGIRIELLKDMFDATFPDDQWKKAYGNLPPTLFSGPKVFTQVQELLEDGCAIFDLTSERRTDENRRVNNGIGLNALFEMGIAIGLKIPFYVIAHSTIIDYKELSARASDLAGSGLNAYDSRKTLQIHLDAARDLFLPAVKPTAA